MNVVLPASLVIGGMVVGSVVGFLAGAHNQAQIRALAALEAQRHFRVVRGFIEFPPSGRSIPRHVAAALADCDEALRISAGELARQVYRS